MAYLILPPEFIPKFSTVINWIMSFTPLISYGTTILSIRKRKSSQGFSIDICATMLSASILRIFYYFNDPFEISLLRQCFVMIFIQTILLYNALKFRPPEAESLEVYDGHWSSVRDRFFEVNTDLLKDEMQECVGEKFPGIDKSLISGISLVIFRNWQRNSMLFGLFLLKLVSEFLRLFDAHYVRPFHFWQWHNAMKYWYFILALVLSTSVLQSIFIGNEHYALMLGSSSFLIESSLPLPQILLFQRVKTVQNFKTILLLSWLAGDLTKISYLLYGTDNVGLIFIIAALFQMSLNLVITYLFFKYRKMDIKRDQGLLPMTVLDDVNSSILLQDLASVEDQVEPKQGKHFVRVRSRAGTVNEHEELAVSRRSTTG